MLMIGGEMSTVRQVLQSKGDQVCSVDFGATVHEALVLMAEKNIGAVMVMDGGDVAGIFSERDYARAGAETGSINGDRLVNEFMTAEVFYTKPDAFLEDCMLLFTGKRIRHLPVKDEGRILGIISIGDVVNATILEQQMTIRELGKYISGV